MRLFALLLFASPLSAQWFSFGVRGGLPLTAVSDSGFEAGRYGGRTHFELKRYSVGPAVEIGLPLHFRFAAEALYQHARQDRFAGPAPTAVLTQQGSRMSIWQIPLLAKYRRHGIFADAGVTLRRVGDLDVDIIEIPTFPGFPGIRRHYSVESDGSAYGASVGGGISWKFGPVRIEPEIRYTHWTRHRWMSTTEEVQFLVGLMWGVG